MPGVLGYYMCKNMTLFVLFLRYNKTGVMICRAAGYSKSYISY